MAKSPHRRWLLPWVPCNGVLLGRREWKEEKVGLDPYPVGSWKYWMRLYGQPKLVCAVGNEGPAKRRRRSPVISLVANAFYWRCPITTIPVKHSLVKKIKHLPDDWRPWVLIPVGAVTRSGSETFTKDTSLRYTDLKCCVHICGRPASCMVFISYKVFGNLAITSMPLHSLLVRYH